MKKNILAIQLQSVLGDTRANYLKVSNMIDDFYKKISDENGPLPDIIVLPEVWTTGWYPDIFKDSIDSFNETEDFLSSIARKYYVNIIGGSYIRGADDLIKNTCPVMDRSGKLIARYDKIHLYSPDGEAKYVSEGHTPVIVNIEGVKIGLSICYDIRFPELFRSYINTPFSPEFLINMSAWPLSRKEQYIIMASSRAIENQAYFLALSQTGNIKGNINNSGNSLIVDPMGNIKEKLTEKEGYMTFKVDTDIVSKVRETYPNLPNRKVHNFGFVPEIAGDMMNV